MSMLSVPSRLNELSRLCTARSAAERPSRRGTHAFVAIPRLGGAPDTVAGHAFDRLAADRLGAVGRGGVEKVDPETRRLADERNSLGLALAGAEAEPAEAAAAEPGNTDLEAGSAKRDVFQ